MMLANTTHPDPAWFGNMDHALFLSITTFLRGSGARMFPSGAHLGGSYLTQGLTCPTCFKNMRPSGSEVS